jgi:MFS family permease
MHAAALLLLTFAQSIWMVGAFAVLNGFAWGARVPVVVSMRAEYFGSRSFGAIMGFSSLVVTGGSVAGPVLAGFWYDSVGSYTAAFTVLAVLAALGSTFLVFTPPPRAVRRPVEATPAIEEQREQVEA